MSIGKVIFIGGTSHSGSTLLDMMIGSGPEGFSGGEIKNLFYPRWRHHLSPICGCGDPECFIWPKVKAKGKNIVYQEIFKMYPHKSFVVDSSKNPYWILYQAKKAQKAGLDVKHVLIWKTPLEFASSRLKRGLIDGWANEWKNYHRLYISAIDQVVSVSYADLALDPKGTLKQICKAIGIEYFGGKEDYWKWDHHTLFGANSAKLHFYDKSSSLYNSCIECLKQVNKVDSSRSWKEKSHRLISYSSPVRKELPSEVITVADHDKELGAIIDLLKITNVGMIRSNQQIKELKDRLRYSPPLTRLLLWRLKLKATMMKIIKPPVQINSF